VKKQTRYDSGHQGGMQIKYELDFSNPTFSKTIVPSDSFMSFKSCEVWIKTVSLTGATGNIEITSGPTVNQADHQQSIGTIAAGANSVNAVSGSINSSFIGIELPSGVTGLTSGKMTIIITAKK